MVYVPRVFVPNNLDRPCDHGSIEDIVGVLSDDEICDYYRVPKCVLIG